MAAEVRKIIEWSAATLPLNGQTKTGDCFVVKLLDQRALVAVVDGLGHGEEAAAAAHLAAQTLEEYTGQHPLTRVLEECHERLRGSRGAVMSLALFNAADSTLTWLGVGDVEGLLLRRARGGEPPQEPQETLLLHAGVLGQALPRLFVTTVPVDKDDLLVFATDGIRPEFATGIRGNLPVQRIAHDILDRYALESDDALVLVARFVYERNTTPLH